MFNHRSIMRIAQISDLLEGEKRYGQRQNNFGNLPIEAECGIDVRQKKSGIRLSAGTDLASELVPLAPPPAAMLSYREWLFRRLRWKPD